MNIIKAFNSLNRSDLFEVGLAQNVHLTQDALLAQILNSISLKVDARFNSASKASLVDLAVEIDSHMFKQSLAQLQKNSNVSELEMTKIMENIYQSFLKHLERNI